MRPRYSSTASRTRSRTLALRMVQRQTPRGTSDGHCPISLEVRLPIEAGIIAFVIGLLGSAAFVLVRIQHGHRLRFRDEIARTAGVPVIVSLDAPTAPPFRHGETFLRDGAGPRLNGPCGMYSTSSNSSGPRPAVRVSRLPATQRPWPQVPYWRYKRPPPVYRPFSWLRPPQSPRTIRLPICG